MTAALRFVASPQAWRLAIALVIAMAALSLLRLPAPPYSTRPGPVPTHPRPPLPALPDAAPLRSVDAEAARRANSRIPIAVLADPPAAPFRFSGDAASRLRARDCLALAAWHEAGDDPPGERAVIQVVLNRARHPAFPGTVCGVVFQGSERRTGCQFTFTCDGALARIPPPAALARARAIAGAALAGAVDRDTGLATHYHADYVAPGWRMGLVKVARRGVHLFYRWPGYWGSAQAMAGARAPLAEPDHPALAAISPKPEPVVGIVPNAGGPPAPPVPATLRFTALEMQIDPAAHPGGYALRALALCGAAPECRVAGRLAQDLAFLYVRRQDSGSDGAWWDCARFPRRDHAQCLPQGAALDRLLADG